MKKIIIGLSFIILSACSSTPTQKPDVVFHPQRPVPVKTFVPNWTVVKEGDNTYVGMTYEESLKYRAWLERLGNYIDTQNKMLCGYRKDLKESQCNKAP